MKRTATALLTGLGLMLSSALAQAQKPSDELLVLGLRGPDGALTTVVADASGIRKLGSGVAVPRAKGWWKLDLLTRRQNSFEESILFAYDASKPAKEPPFQFDEGCENSTKELLLFVGPDHYSKEVSSNGFCQGAAHPWSSVLLATVALDAGNASESLPIDKLLGKEVFDAWASAADKAHRGKKQREKACLDEARPEEWALVRQKGQWIVRGELNYLSEACRGKHEYFSVESTLPARLTGPNALPQPWSKYASGRSLLTDVVVSPSRRLSALLTADQLELRADDKAIARLEEAKMSVVLAQWATGANAARWRAELTKLFDSEQAAAQSP